MTEQLSVCRHLLRRRLARTSNLIVAVATSAILASTYVTPVLSLSERDTLIRFYHRAGGSSWDTADGWREAAEGGDDSSQTPICSWFGVICSSESNTSGEKVVTEISLGNNHLSGHVTPQLWEMPFLKVVDLRGNLLGDAGLIGFRSDFNTATTTRAPIERLILSDNRFDSLEGIESAPTSLIELHISANSFKGSFPKEVYKLRKLQILRATFNQDVIGTLSTEIGHLTHMRELDVSYNSLDGQIPAEIGKMTALEYLTLEENNFTGTLPPEMDNLVNLKFLSARNTSPGSGRIKGLLPSFRNLANLREMYLESNGITGTIPSDFLGNSNVTDQHLTINLSSNLLSGKVPRSLAVFSHMYLDVTENRISGISNELCKIKGWMNGEVGPHGCDAILCPKGTFATLGRRVGEDGLCQACLGGEQYAPYMGSTDCIEDLVDNRDDIEEVSSSSSSSGSAGGSGGVDDAVAASSSAEPKRSGLTSVGKFLIVLVILAVPVVLLYALYKGMARSRAASGGGGGKAQSSIVTFPNDEDLESSMDAWQGRFPVKKSSASSKNERGGVNDGSPTSIGTVSTEPERCIL